MQLKLYSVHARFSFAKKLPIQMQPKLYSGHYRFYRLDVGYVNYDWNTTVAMSKYFLVQMSTKINAVETQQWLRAFFSLNHRIQQGLLIYYSGHNQVTVAIFAENFAASILLILYKTSSEKLFTFLISFPPKKLQFIFSFVSI